MCVCVCVCVCVRAYAGRGVCARAPACVRVLGISATRLCIRHLSEERDRDKETVIKNEEQR